MAFLIHHVPNRQTYIQTQLFGVGRCEDDATLRKNFRIIVASLLAQGYDEDTPPNGIAAELFDVLTSEGYYLRGYNKTTDERLWFCSYVGFEKITSKWAKETYPNCKGCLCMRVMITNITGEETNHTVQVYF